MTSTLDWKSSHDPQDIVHIVVQALVEGKLVALPLETAYHGVASGLSPQAVASLLQLRADGHCLSPSLFLRSPQEVFDYVTTPSVVAERVISRGWPGPLTLELAASNEHSLAQQLPEEVRQAVMLDGQYLPLRVAVHDAITHAMRLLPGPLVAAPLLAEGGQPTYTGSEVSGGATARSRQPADGSSDPIALVVDDGPTHFRDLATWLRIEQNECTVVHQGAVKGENLYRLGQFVVLLVCTGNTCRSPMAEALLKQKLKNQFPRYVSSDSPLIHVGSAGISAYPGGPASPEAIAVLKKRGLSLVDHQSAVASERMLKYADVILTMTGSHRNAILDRLPELEPKVHLLSGDEVTDVADPFGGSQANYADCADQIDRFLDGWLANLDPAWLPRWHLD